MIHFHNLDDLHKAVGIPSPRHPMISLYSFVSPISLTNYLGEFSSDFYWIGLKKIRSGIFLYGRTQYDHNAGSMYFAKPDQIIETKNIEYEIKGFVICLHKDFFIGKPFFSQLKNFTFFDYEVNEALHLSDEEESLIWDTYSKIEREYYANQDEFSYHIIWSHINNILQYAQRFYKQQFINRSPITGKQVTRFHRTLEEYIQSNALTSIGLPTVKYMAGKMNISAGYLSDLLKQETGKTAIEHIHLYLIQHAKELLINSDFSISEIAFKTGFENLPYFSKLFKKEVGMTPTEFRKR
jgi:AraC family transcriptional regulator, transcriptional activator of pobA